MGAVALLAAALLANVAWISGILWFLAFLRAPAHHASGRLTLVLAATGGGAQFATLLDALTRQTLMPTRLILCAESETDPVVAQARATPLPFPMDIAIAGLAERCSQKGLNLAAGFALLDGSEDAIVLLDADILPGPGWLSALATPALNGAADVVTGYRWHMPGGGPVRHAVVWLDRALALGPRFVASSVVWGGSIAIARESFVAMRLSEALQKSFSTDGAISRRAGETGARMLTRRAVLLPTPPEGGEASAWGFKRRQLQILRIYRPGFWGLLGLLLHMEACALPLALLGAWWAAAPLAALALLRAGLHDHVGRRIGVPDAPAALFGQALVSIFAPPLILALFWSSAFWRTIRWRHVEYRIDGPNAVRVVRRAPPAALP
ncbi:glycosyltransferase [Plastoroseomonas arctica]|uniref:Glycosyltransferase n=1 Tax=Plastoroseomonas arctica TaxID=1509237 RepID=A0AAF1KME8_9PROT|nr:glycosyltransferase [Plastoroseomonas arctica]MBR0655649.1 glycosyltransferase [Plastoroseomonas arctica]